MNQEMDTFRSALVSKLKSKQKVTDKFGDRIHRLFNINDPSILTTFNKFPFIGIQAGIIDRDHYGSQLVDEDMKPKIWIFHQLHGKEIQLSDELFALQAIVMNELEYDIDFEGTEYKGARIIEAYCIQLGEPESVNNYPAAGKISLTMHYLRTLEEVLV